MLKATLRFLKKGRGSKDDEIIHIYEANSDGMFEVNYISPELRGLRSFVAPEHRALQYVDDVLTSIRHDIDPFEKVQVNTAIHPPILYHSFDMDNYDIRHLILNMIRDSMRVTVTRKAKNEFE